MAGHVHLEIASIAGAKCAAAQNKQEDATTTAVISDTRVSSGFAQASIIAQEDTSSGEGNYCVMSFFFAVMALLLVATKFSAWYRRTRDYTTLHDGKTTRQEES